MKILLTNSGRRPYMVEYLRQIREQVDFPVKIAVSDTSLDRSVMMMGSDIESYKTRRVDIDPLSYAQDLLALCVDNHVDVVIPLMDFELPILAEMRDVFTNASVSVVVSDEWVITSTLNKQLFYRKMASEGLSVPRVAYHGDDLSGFPVPAILKPIKGSGSVGMRMIERRSGLPSEVPVGNVLQEFVEGVEFGMDVFNDMEGLFVHATVKRKIAMRCGETDIAEVLPVNMYESYARRLSEVFRHRGNLDIDFIVDPDGTPWFIDANPRFGGGYPFTHNAGVNYLRYLVDVHAGRVPTALPDPRPILGAKGLQLYFREIIE